MTEKENENGLVGFIKSHSTNIGNSYIKRRIKYKYFSYKCKNRKIVSFT